MTGRCFGAPVLGVDRSMSGQRWGSRLDDAGHRVALTIAQTHGLPDLVCRVLASRGVGIGECRAYLEPSLRALMPDPSCLADMDAAVERLSAAVAKREAVAVLGDYDVDGAASVALLAEYLAAAGCPCLTHIPDRIREGYGPSIEAIGRLAADGATLLVTVDCGSGSHAALAEAHRLGLDTVILDHHGIATPFPRAAAIVNPNRPDDLSGLGHLCAAGVVFLTLVALQRILRGRGIWAGRPEPDLLAGLDLVALATVADVVPLTGLNRAFVAKGLQVAARRERPGLAALLDAAGTRGQPTAYHFGFMVGPRINAGGRIGDAALGARLLMTRDASEARCLATELDRLNRDRRAIEAEATEQAEAEASMAAAADAENLLVVVAQAGWHPGIVGLVAARLKERLRRPVFAVALNDGVGVGSGRSVAGVDIGRLVRAAVQAGVLRKGGGHAMAAGLTLDADRLEAFRAFARSYLADADSHVDRTPVLEIDAVLGTSAGATPEMLRHVDRAGPYGAGSPEPVIAVSNGRLVDFDSVGEGGVRLTLQAPDGHRLRALAFRAARTPLAEELASARGRLIHCAGTLTLNAWGGGTPRVEMRLLDAAPAGLA